MPLPVRRAYKGAPVTTTINSNISNSATSVTVGSVTGWPTTFPFFAVLSPGTSKEEKISVTGITSTTLTIVRGVDDTSASAHDAGATIYPVFTALEANEANLMASTMTAKGDILSVSGTTPETLAFARLGVGSNAHVLQADDSTSTGLKWAAVGTSNISDGAITLGKLASALQAFLVPTGSINAWSTNTAPTGWQLCDGTAVSRTTYAALYAVIGTTYGAGDGSTTFNLPNLKGRVIVGRDAAQTEFDSLAETGGAKTHTLTSSEMPAHVHNVSAYSHSASIGNTNLSHTHTFSGTVVSGGAHSHTITVTDPGHVHTRQYGSVSRQATGTATTVPVNGGGIPNFDTGSSTTGITASSNSTGSHDHTYSGTTSSTLGDHNHSISISNHDAKDTASTGGGNAHNNLQPYMVLNYIIKH